MLEKGTIDFGKQSMEDLGVSCISDVYLIDFDPDGEPKHVITSLIDRELAQDDGLDATALRDRLLELRACPAIDDLRDERTLMAHARLRHLALSEPIPYRIGKYLQERLWQALDRKVLKRFIGVD